jgi:hypothetical protein
LVVGVVVIVFKLAQSNKDTQTRHKATKPIQSLSPFLPFIHHFFPPRIFRKRKGRACLRSLFRNFLRWKQKHRWGIKKEKRRRVE